MLTLEEYAAARDTTVRTVRRWLSEGRLPDAVLIEGRRLIPTDAHPGSAQEGREMVAAHRPHVTDLTVTSPTPGQDWWTVDELAHRWAPYVSAYAIVEMIHAGELAAFRRGRNRAWIIPNGEVVRLGGA